MRMPESFQRTEESSQRTLDGVQSPFGANYREAFRARSKADRSDMDVGWDHDPGGVFSGKRVGRRTNHFAWAYS